MTTGFLLVDKPSGWTSHDVVAKVRRLLGQKKVGHAGTLDPMATGLLVLAAGRATRLLRFVQAADKVYVARMQLGVATDTLDADGAVLSREPMDVAEDEIVAVAERFRGPIMQVPPMVSALKVEGRRLYDLAREGIEVEREARPVTIHELDVLDVAPGAYPEVAFRVRCSTGTYVRTLGDDIARALGGRAHLTDLRRLAIGALRVDASVTIDELERAADEGTLDEIVRPPGAGVAGLPSVTVGEESAAAVANGVVFPAVALGVGEEGEFAVFDDDGELLAVYESDGRRAKPAVVIA
ncbi:MAG: tRNA pseudouridine(55) synthase TruB [Acidimicrobiia bacterium]|nr:tRNA pseudouridine(55) synthase TruB [Acidimicrobiia bacterium]